MNKWTTARAARATNCSKHTISRLLRAGHLEGTRQGRTWVIVATKDELTEVVNSHVKKHGWKRRSNRTQPILPFAPSPSTDAGFTQARTIPLNLLLIPLEDITFWINLTQVRRDLLQLINTQLVAW